MQPRTFRLLTAAVCFGLSYHAHAAGTLYTWVGGTSNDMNDVTNWNPNLPAGSPSPALGNSSSSGTVLVFDNTAQNTSPNLDTTVANIDQILFSANAPAFTFSGSGELQPQNGGFESITNNSAFTQTFNIDTAGYATLGVDAAAADIKINATFHAGADSSTSANHTAVLTGSHDIYLKQITGGNSMVYNGLGATSHLFLSSSSYTAGITVNSGLVVPADNNSFGTTAGSTTISGGTTGTGSVLLQGGLTIPESFTLAGRTAAANASLPSLVSLSGSNKITGNSTGTGSGSVTIESRGAAGGDFLEFAGNLNHSTTGTPLLNLVGAGNGLFSGNITANSGNFDIVKDGDGTWTLAGANNVNSSYIVHHGKLVLTAASSNAGIHYIVDAPGILVVDSTSMSGDSTYAISGTLGGKGTIHGTTTITGGTLAPGDSPGTLTMANLTFGAGGATMAYDLDAVSHAVGGGVNDLTVASAVDLTGGAVLNVTPQNGSTLSLGIYELIDYTGLLTGSAANIALGSVPVPQGDYAQIQIDSDSVNLAVLAPEPTSLGLVGVGLLGFMRRRRQTHPIYSK